jgi:hypothetical protein
VYRIGSAAELRFCGALDREVSPELVPQTPTITSNIKKWNQPMEPQYSL